MKIATVILSLVFAGMFAHAQAPEAGPATGSSEGAKMEAPAKTEKKEKKHKKHSKKEKSEKTEEGTATK